MFSVESRGLCGSAQLIGHPCQNPTIQGVQAVTLNGVLLEGLGLVVVVSDMPPLRTIIVRLETGCLRSVLIGDLFRVVGAQLEQPVLIAIPPSLPIPPIRKPPTLVLEQAWVDLFEQGSVGPPQIDFGRQQAPDGILRVSPGDGEYPTIRVGWPLAVLAEHPLIVLPGGYITNQFKGLLFVFLANQQGAEEAVP